MCLDLPFKHLLRLPTYAKFASKLALGVVLLTFLSGYQPVLTFPPTIKQSTVKAEIPTQTIDAKTLPFEFQLPHPGYLSTQFSTYHPGVDIATGLGMPVKPIAPGKVVDTGYNFWGLGLVITIEHEAGFRSTYAHLGKIYVKKDQIVTHKDLLGEVGLTGNTSGPHTHLEITKEGKYTDPLALLPKMRDFPKEEDFLVYSDLNVKNSTPSAKKVN